MGVVLLYAMAAVQLFENGDELFYDVGSVQLYEMVAVQFLIC